MSALANLGPIGGIASSLLGGIFGSSSASKQAKAQREADERNAALQREFAQNSIQWKTADAEKAGIHKLYALGAQTNPGMAAFSAPLQDNSMGNAIADAGSGLARAAAAGQTNLQRLQERLLGTQIEGQEIDNAERRSRLALSSGAMSSPPFPDQNRVDMVNDEVTKSAAGDSGLRAGRHPLWQQYDLGRGRSINLPSSDGGPSEALEGLPWPYAWAKTAEMLYKSYDYNTPGYNLSKWFKRR